MFFFCRSFLLFMLQVCLCYTVLSVSCSIVITCWDRAGLLALLCGMFPCVLSLSHIVPWVLCGVSIPDMCLLLYIFSIVEATYI